MRRVRVEFFGVPRERAACASIEVPVSRLILSEVLAETARQLPEFGRRCLIDGRLQAGLIANISGRQFTADVTTQLTDDDSVLILSADVGG